MKQKEAISKNRDIGLSSVNKSGKPAWSNWRSAGHTQPETTYKQEKLFDNLLLVNKIDIFLK
jgi:hypothetical protein